MKSAWTTSVYIRSEMPLTNKVLPTMELTFITFGNQPPTKVLIEAFASSHVKNVQVLASETEYTPIPDELLPDL